ncbi:MAG: ribonuclease R [Leadbetterella sp.]
MLKRKKKSTIQQQKEDILDFLNSSDTKFKAFTEILVYLGINDPEEHIFIELILQELIVADKIILQNGTYGIVNKEEKNILSGKLDFVNPNFGFVRYHEENADIFVPKEDLNGALDGDIVEVRIVTKKQHGKNPVGVITNILQRGRDRIVGKLKSYGNYGIVTPDVRGYHDLFFIPKDKLNGAETYDLVIVKIIEYPSMGAQGVGEIDEVLGKAGNNTAEMHAIMAEFDLPIHFPKEVLEESEKISEIISTEEIKKRRDFRDILTFTIDPHDAKDFDDAISYQTLANGNVEVGVHIADVSHYLQENTAMEKEAKMRATSVYLVDRTIPMLPEKLSNGLCSLRPKEDKLVFSAVFEMNEKAEVVKNWFGRCIIHSDRRFTYEEAQEVLEGDPQADPAFGPQLHHLNTLAKILKNERFRKGAFNFETNEVKFNLDENGKPTGVYQKVRKDAHKLIEEFMLLANKQVAMFVGNMHKKHHLPDAFTMVYRVHEPPNPTKVDTFAKFAQKLGFAVKTTTNAQLSQSLNALMHGIEGTPMQNILEGLAVRTMSKARYSTQNLGHFGLAFDYYSHFTSPIRRYPDVMAHRMLQHYLDGGKSLPLDIYEENCKHSSDREKLAAEAERASIKYKQVEYMSYQPRTEVYEGVVSGVTDFGIFVEIKGTGCEGMARLADLNDDFYEYDADNFRVVGRRTQKIIGFGAEVKVKILNTDIEKRSMDLQLISAGKSTFSSVNKSPMDRSRNSNSRGHFDKNRGSNSKSGKSKKSFKRTK